MNFRIFFGLIFLSFRCIIAQDVIDHSVISVHAHSMKNQKIQKQQLLQAACQGGIGALCAYLLYYSYTAYTYNNITVPLTAPAELVEQFRQTPEMFKDAIEKYIQSKNTWSQSTYGVLVNLSGSIILQSLIVQALQPVYQKIQSYFASNVSVPVSRSWFLAEQYQGSPKEMQSKKVEITQELSEWIMHIESLEFAYTNHDAGLILDSAQLILSHILFIKECETSYTYQQNALQNIYNALSDVISKMAQDAGNSVLDGHNLKLFKDCIRELRKLPAYSII